MKPQDIESVQGIFGADYIELCCALNTIFEDYKKVEEWLFSPNPVFHDHSPILLVISGRVDHVLKHVNLAISENIKGEA